MSPRHPTAIRRAGFTSTTLLRMFLLNRLASLAVGLLVTSLAPVCSQPDAASEPPEEPLLIVAFGDSTTAPRKGVDRVYADRLADALRVFSVESHVVNAGVPGDTTRHASARFRSDVLDRRPDAVVIQFGLNDAAVDVWAGRDRPRVPLKEYKRRLRKMVRAALDQGIKVVVMSPNAVRWTEALKKRYGKPPYDPEDEDGFSVLIAKYAQAVQDVAIEFRVGYLDCFHVLRSIKTWGPDESPTLLDGMHPSDAGHTLIAKMLARRVRDERPEVRAPVTSLDRRQVVLVENGVPKAARFTRGGAPRVEGGKLEVKGRDLVAGVTVLEGDFTMRAHLELASFGGTAASIQIGARNWLGFDSLGGGGKRLFLHGGLFGGGVTHLEPGADVITEGEPFRLDVARRGSVIRFSIDGKQIHEARHRGPIRELAIVPNRGTLRVAEWVIGGTVQRVEAPAPGYSIPIVDISGETAMQHLVDREKGQYLGHPTTVLLEDGKTILCVYPKGHGKGGIVYKRSSDGGRTWSERLPTPDNWKTSKEVPTLHRVVDKSGKKRVIMWSGLYPARLAVSEDDGATWSPLKKVGDWGGIVVMSCVERLKNGDYMALFHDDGRFFSAGGRRDNPSRFYVYKTVSEDGGLTWGEPEVIATHETAHLCEPGIFRSPDGKRLAVLLRENSRRHNGFVIFSDDEGETWTAPRHLPAALTGDRHTGVYAPDGRLFISFRDRTLDSPTHGDWVGWVGRFDDIVNGTEGQYRVRIMDNKKGADCAYPGVVIQPDGTIVTTTYGHWTRGEAPYIMTVRFKLDELDARLKK